MAYSNPHQQQQVDVRKAQTQYILVLSAVPAAAAQSLLGKALLDAGALTVAGEYRCRIMTNDWNDMSVHLKPSAVTGTFAPTLEALMWHENTVGTPVAHPTLTAAGSNFAAGTAQALTLTDLRGVTKADLKFTIPGSGAITFASASSLAEYHGL